MMPHESNQKIFAVRGTFWRLPVIATENVSGIHDVTIASIPLLEKQREVVSEMLQSKCYASTPGVWSFTTEQLLSIASRWDRSAEECVIWNPPEIRARGIWSIRSKNWIEMRSGLVEDGWFGSEVEADLAMHIIYEAMFHRLINDLKTVDLGFCELIPSPRATDFCDRVDSWCRTNKIGAIDKVAAIQPDNRDRLLDHLCTSELTVVNHFNERTLWWLCVMPGFLWFERSAKREKRIFEKMGEHEYKRYIEECLKQTLPEAIRILDAWRKQKNYASPRRNPRRPSKSKGDAKKKSDVASVAESGVVDVCGNDSNTGFTGRPKNNMAPENEVLPKLPDFRPDPTYMRRTEFPTVEKS